MNNKKLLNLESLRGIAAILVVFFHFNINSHFNNNLTNNSWLMVDLFFVLSGFVISLNYIDKLKTLRELYAFQEKRFLRLYPLHLLMLVIFLVIEFAKYIAEIKFDLVAYNRAFSSNNLYSFIANLFLIQNWVLPTTTYNSPSWSISAEFFTYAIFAVIVYCTQKLRGVMFVILVLSIILSYYILSINGMGTDNVAGPVRCIYSFFIGVLTQQIFAKISYNSRVRTSIPGVMLIALSIILVTFSGENSSGVTLLIPLVFSATIFCLVSTNQKCFINKILVNKVLVYFGKISYSIYMIHFAVLWIIIQIMRFAFHFKTVSLSDGSMHLIVENVFLADVISIFAILLIIIISHFSYYYIEMRFNRIRKSFQ